MKKQDQTEKVQLVNQLILKGIFILFISFNLVGCRVYNSSNMTLSEVKSENQITENMDVYEFYVKTDDKSYKIEEPSFNEDGTIEGELVETVHETPDSSWSKKERQKYFKEHLYEVNINYTDDFRQDLASLPQEKRRVALQSEKIESISVTTVDKEKEVGQAALIVLIVLAVLLTLGLIFLIIIAAAAASSEATSAGSDGSSESNSNSDGSSEGSSESGSSG